MPGQTSHSPEQALEARLAQLQEELMTLGSLVEALLIESADLLQKSNLGSLEQLTDDEREVRETRQAVEMECLHLITALRPKDRDLRSAVAIVEIAAELEGIGQYAGRVARANGLVQAHDLRKPMASIHRQAARVQGMLDRVLTAFLQRDIVLVQSIAAEANEVELQHRQVYRDLLHVMDSRPRLANQALYVARAAHNLRQAAERITAIGGWVAFMILGTMEEPYIQQPQPAGQAPQQASAAHR
jgi:phosphate transport system protein